MVTKLVACGHEHKKADEPQPEDLIVGDDDLDSAASEPHNDGNTDEFLSELSLTSDVLLSMWRVASTKAVCVRTAPNIDSKRTEHKLESGEIFTIFERVQGCDGILYLRLEDGRGWTCDEDPGVGVLCVNVLDELREAARRREMFFRMAEAWQKWSQPT